MSFGPDRPAPAACEAKDCGRPFPVLAPGEYGATGYAYDSATREFVCYFCADARQVAALKTETTYGAYVSGDAKTITTWSGGLLMRVLYTSELRSGFGGRQLYVRARDVHGAEWYGRGAGAGMSIHLKRAKA